MAKPRRVGGPHIKNNQNLNDADSTIKIFIESTLNNNENNCLNCQKSNKNQLLKCSYNNKCHQKNYSYRHIFHE
jgi:hypothetical protein